MVRQTVWVVVADARSARLMRCEPQGERRHLEAVDDLQEHWEEKEHHRPQPLSGKAGHAYAAWGHEDEERLHRYAKTLTEWLGRHRAEHSDDLWAIIAPPRLLGAVRNANHRKLDDMTQVEAELTDLSSAQLARHPAFARACGA